jgi:hypothetical protein
MHSNSPSTLIQVQFYLTLAIFLSDGQEQASQEIHWSYEDVPEE